MDATPRLRSAFPSTPQTDRRRPPPRYGNNIPVGGQHNPSKPTISPLKPPTSSPSSGDPLIPQHILDAPSQRLFSFSVWVLLQTWKIFDFVTLQESEEQSLWLFMKWLAIDGTFLYGLPSLRIPWLEWSPSTMTMLFCLHAFSDGMLMFRIPVPIGAGLAAVGRSIWGAYELAISERSVNPESIKFNESLILGRQIIHVLPEGSAILNPDRKSFCLDESNLEARLPIKINSTNPISMELLRIDLELDTNETISISKSQIKTMHRDASRLMTYSEKPNEPKTLYYTVNKPGVYLLQKVVDESNLEVSRKHLAHTSVVSCPRAMILTSTTDRCKGELADIDLEVMGTPPLRVTYQKFINGAKQNTGVFESIMPDDFFSPLTKQEHNAITVPKSIDTAWAKPRTVRVPLTEILGTAGKWLYSIEEVKDGFGNTVHYRPKSNDGQGKQLSKVSPIHQAMTVHERPTVAFEGCSPQSPRKEAKGKEIKLPLKYGSSGHGELRNTAYRMDFVYTPEGDRSGSDNGANAQRTLSMTSSRLESVKEPGLYTITGVSTEFCQGEVLEPASCLLQNPPEPKLSISKEEIFDKCAGSPIGLRVDFNLIGTPPFEITYRTTRTGDSHHKDNTKTVNGLRGQIELTPQHAGHYSYQFLHISDAVYKTQRLQGLALDQDVKPSASAWFADNRPRLGSCIDDASTFHVQLQGESPFNLEYELVHNGKRVKHTKNNIESTSLKIETEPLHQGGDYTLALTSITDRMGCKEFLNHEVKVAVRNQKPKVGFGHIEGKRSVTMFEGRKAELPLRLVGEPPWKITWKDSTGAVHTMNTKNANDRIAVTEQGSYELIDLHDSGCPGVVDEQAKSFEVSWTPRPELRIPPGDGMEHKNGVFVRAEVCEGDDDMLEVLFKGSAPYQAHYAQTFQPVRGAMVPKNKILRTAANVGSLLMDTSQAGLYEYKFNMLSDSNYDHSTKHFSPLTVKQRVNSRPSAAFTNPGKTYSYCSVESDGEEVIPIILHGEPPFDLEIEIRHQSTARPETVSLNGIATRKHDVRIPHSRLQLGKSSVSLRRVSDNKGCARTLDSSTPRIQISVHDAPTITPMETSTNFCVGDRLNFALAGAAPFNIFYTFEGSPRKAVATSSTFRRLAEKPGEFVITGVQDSASVCRSSTNITKIIHGLPSARVSQGRESYIDIHEGGVAEIFFEFGGIPPFEFTYTRSSNTARGATKAGTVLDMKSEISDDYSMRILAHEEGTYEVVAIKDRHCAYAKPGVKLDWKEAQKRLGY